MEISDLLGRLKSKDQSKPTPFLALELTDEIVVAAVWQVLDGKTEIVSLGTPVEWNGDKEDGEELVRAVDATISSATEGVEGEPDQIIFGVIPGWAEGSSILPAKLMLIKKICKDLEYKPLGFVVVTDSLLRYLKMQEGIPATSLLVHVGRDAITVSLVKLGVIEFTEVVGRGDDIATDVVEAISRFGEQDKLPARILVYDGMHALDDEVQNLISYDWKESFNFLHIPKIESLPKDVVIRSIAVAGGMEVAKAIGFDITEPIIVPPVVKTKTAPIDNVVPVEEPIEKDDVSTKAAFVVDREEDPDDEELMNEEATETSDNRLLTAEDFGFTEPELPPQAGLPAQAGKKKPVAHQVQAQKITLTDDVPEDDHEDDEKVRSFIPNVSLPPLPKIKLPMVKLPSLKLPKFHLPSVGLPLMIIAGLLVIGLIAIGVSIWLIPKATVTLAIEPRELPETSEFTVSSSATQIDAATATIPGVIQEKSVNDQDSVPTTGTKTIGDPAKGEVTVYNRTSLPKSFAKGTVITGKSLKFTLDDGVTVASKSANADYVDVPGKATVKVTARAIGSESNVGENTEFTVETFTKDTYVARNDNAFAGGSSQEIRAIDAKDIEVLRKNLRDKLSEQAKGELMNEIGSGIQIVPLDSATEVDSEEFSGKAGDQADTVSGSATVIFKGLSFRTDDLATLLESTLTAHIPDGYEKTEDLPVVEIGEIKDEDAESARLTATISIRMLPKIDKETVKEAVRGKAGKDVESALSGVVGYKGATVEITPRWLPGWIKRLPRNTDNISVNVVSAE